MHAELLLSFATLVDNIAIEINRSEDNELSESLITVVIEGHNRTSNLASGALP